MITSNSNYLLNDILIKFKAFKKTIMTNNMLICNAIRTYVINM